MRALAVHERAWPVKLEQHGGHSRIAAPKPNQMPPALLQSLNLTSQAAFLPHKAHSKQVDFKPYTTLLPSHCPRNAQVDIGLHLLKYKKHACPCV